MKKLLLGNEAIARGAWEAGVHVCSSYPGTPSTEITEVLAKTEGPHVEWAPNEKVALETAYGAALAGGRALCCMKHVGLNVAADPLFTAAYTGISAGLVIVVADDPGMHSSQNEQDSRFYARSAHVPMLEPADSAEAYAMVQRAFEISEAYDTPVLLRVTTRVAHARSLVELGDRREVPVREYKKDVAKYVMMPGMARARHVAVEARMQRLVADAATLAENTIEMRDKALGVICSGVTYRYVREALPQASTLKLGMVYPIATDLAAKFAAQVDKLLVIEELEPFFENQLKAVGIACEGKRLTGVQGELSVRKVAELFGDAPPPLRAEEPLPGRPPVLCPGCPHRATFQVVSQLKLRAFGDIGCYTLGALPPLGALDACLCMGAGVSMAHGAEKAQGREFGAGSVAVIGDSTFLHTGIQGLMNAVYNQSGMTLLILDNGITAMTGHQEHAGTGKNARGLPSPSIKLEALCEALGVKRIAVVDPFDKPELQRILREETASPEVSVIIARRPCALLVPPKPKPELDEAKCKACGVCTRLACPAMASHNKRPVIDAALCNGCGLCVRACTFGALKGEA